MAGIHGKNSTLRVSTSETLISGVAMPGTQGGIFQVASASQRDWRYDRDNTLIQFDATNQGPPSSVNPNGTDINTQTRYINYAGGAIHLGAYPTVISGVYAMATSMTLTTIGNLVGDNRNYTVAVNSDSVESTVIGESWKTFEDGLSGFEGSLEGLAIDNYWYKQSIQTLSGLAPRLVLRFQFDPKFVTSYYQGTVIFPSWELNGGYDQLVEYSVDFQGRGPLDLIDRGTPYFKTNDVS